MAKGMEWIDRHHYAPTNLWNQAKNNNPDAAVGAIMDGEDLAEAEARIRSIAQ